MEVLAEADTGLSPCRRMRVVYTALAARARDAGGHTRAVHSRARGPPPVPWRAGARVLGRALGGWAGAAGVGGKMSSPSFYP